MEHVPLVVRACSLTGSYKATVSHVRWRDHLGRLDYAESAHSKRYLLDIIHIT